jgi:hypothetical protein
MASRFDSLAAAMQEVLMAQFATTAQITVSGCAQPVTVDAIFNVNADAMPAGGERNPRPQPEAFLRTADVPEGNLIGARIEIDGRAYRIVRIENHHDAQVRLELGHA